MCWKIFQRTNSSKMVFRFAIIKKPFWKTGHLEIRGNLARSKKDWRVLFKRNIPHEKKGLEESHHVIYAESHHAGRKMDKKIFLTWSAQADSAWIDVTTPLDSETDDGSNLRCGHRFCNNLYYNYYLIFNVIYYVKDVFNLFFKRNLLDHWPFRRFVC